MARPPPPSRMGEPMRRLGLSWQKAQPSHPKADTAAREAFAKKGGFRPPSARRAAHPDKRLTLWFHDEARFGQKGRVCHRWFTRGQRRTRAHLFAGIRPATGEDFALALPHVSTAAMTGYLARFAATLAGDKHAVLALDSAGRRRKRSERQ